MRPSILEHGNTFKLEDCISYTFLNSSSVFCNLARTFSFPSALECELSPSSNYIGSRALIV